MARAAAKSARKRPNRAKAAAKPKVRPAASKPKAAPAPKSAGSGKGRVPAPPRSSGSTSPRSSTQRPIELFFWPTPNGWKVSIMLEEVGLPYVIRPVNIGRGEQTEAEFLKISPNGRIPALTDPDGPGGRPLSLFESGAILQYLGRKSGKLYPEDPRKRAEVEQWLFWQVGGLGPMAGQAQHFRAFAPEKIPYAIERYGHEITRLYSVMNARLADRPFLAGAYSIADIACFGWVHAHQMHGIQLSDFPAVKAWFERLTARAAVQRGLKVSVDMRAPGEFGTPGFSGRRGYSLTR